MQLTSNLGQMIISRIEEYIEVDINIMNLNGKIVASTDKSRINSIHSGAMEVIKTGSALIINEKNMQDYKGSKPGANLPIIHQDKMEGVIGVSGNPDEISPITGLIRASVEIALEQIYVQRQANFKERQWNYWLQQLLHPSGLDEKKLEEESIYTLNISTKKTWKVIVLYGESIQNLLEIIREKVIDQEVKALFTLIFSKNEIIITIPATFKHLDELVELFINVAKGNLKVGVGESAFGIKGIRSSYNQAKQALLFKNKKGTVSYSSDWKIERLATSIHKTEYDSICLHYEKMLKGIGTDYIKTIDTYFSMNFSIKETSTLLHIHRNTLLYRLDQIKDKVGLDPRNFHDAFILKVIRSR